MIVNKIILSILIIFFFKKIQNKNQIKKEVKNQIKKEVKNQIKKEVIDQILEENINLINESKNTEEIENLIINYLIKFKKSLDENLIDNLDISIIYDLKYTVDVITVFDDNIEHIINYFRNIIILNTLVFKMNFYILDMSLNENICCIIKKIILKLDLSGLNIIIKRREKYNFSLEKNYIIKNIKNDYILLLEPAIYIKDLKFINDLISNINDEIKCVGCFGETIKYNSVISTKLLSNININIPINSRDIFINHSCTIFDSKIFRKFYFDININPFLFEDLEFMLNFNKIYKTKKIKHTLKFLPTRTKDDKLIKQITLRNSHYIMGKHNIINNEIFNCHYINKPNYEKYNELEYQNFPLFNTIDNIIQEIGENVLNSENNVLTISDSIYPPAGGGENWLLNSCDLLHNYNHICVCFKDVFNRVNFVEDKLIKYKDNIWIIQTEFDYSKIFYLNYKFKFKFIHHQGNLRYEIAEISKIMNIHMISCFCFWDGLLHSEKKLINVDMINNDYLIDNNFLKYKEDISFYYPSQFVKDIAEKNKNYDIPIIENISTLNLENIKPNTGKYVSLLNCHPLKGGIELLYILEHLDINIPILGIITEKMINFENKIIEAFEKRNSIKNINILFTEKQKDIEEIYNKTKVILIPSLVDETYCKVCYESVILNKKIISYNNGNLKYLLNDYNDVIIIKNNIQDYYQNDFSVEDLINNKSNENKMQEWVKNIENIYFIPTSEFINYKKINDDKNKIICQFNKIIDKNNKKKWQYNIGIYGPFCDQGLGIQMRNYYNYLNKITSVIIYSHTKRGEKITDIKEWEGYEIFYSQYRREKPNFNEIMLFVKAYKINTIIIPEICFNFIHKLILYFKILNVKVLTPINIETNKYEEKIYMNNIDIILTNNYYSYLIMKNTFKDRVKLLEYNTEFPKLNKLNKYDKGYYIFSCFGGKNSLIRKNIDNIYYFFRDNSFMKENKNRFVLNIYIQEPTCYIEDFYETDNINIVIENLPYSEIICKINESDFMIHMGNHEGLGLGFFEALNNNVPLITLNTFPNNEYVIHKVNGFIIDCEWEDLKDNNSGIVRKAVFNHHNFEENIKYILDYKNTKEIINLINSDKVIINNFKNNLYDLLTYTNIIKNNVIFSNDNNVNVKLIKHKFSQDFQERDNHEVMFRRINTYLIKNKIIDGNIIDLGAWIGDNSIPWAMNFSHIIYSIDPSTNNINYIEQMVKANNIMNIKTIQNAISDKNEIIGTSDDINHCSFSKKGGKTKVESVTLDYLYSQGKIDNISYIHLDVEGFEYNVIKGSENIIKLFKPIISYEQHLETDNYKELSLYLYNQGYNIYLINEILPGCRLDCRNLFAFPNNIKIKINEINTNIGRNVLLSISNWENSSYNYLFTATLYGNGMSNKIFKNVKSVEYDGKHIFCINDNNYTKIVVIDKNKKWICGKYLQGEINILCKQSIINAYLTAQGKVLQNNYNIKDILQFTPLKI